ncbi:hypothetical protein JM93_00826 [Roseibium hamelinense]|uniref:Uncharacterized protein n=1 Tax=Roseibium hamelinense TaxID=150831 RepID=A0A562THY9_9HYPH|nr:hypothetical protein [Roseibium hamelinense]MTI42647.1 hypothetical protein [Roseibium hamelinense]TWI93271.1 hypothetical protein JM93_00826 [Roseibium hamelinense]
MSSVPLITNSENVNKTLQQEDVVEHSIGQFLTKSDKKSFGLTNKSLFNTFNRSRRDSDDHRPAIVSTMNGMTLSRELLPQRNVARHSVAPFLTSKEQANLAKTSSAMNDCLSKSVDKEKPTRLQLKQSEIKLNTRLVNQTFSALISNRSVVDIDDFEGYMSDNFTFGQSQFDADAHARHKVNAVKNIPAGEIDQNAFQKMLGIGHNDDFCPNPPFGVQYGRPVVSKDVIEAIVQHPGTSIHTLEVAAEHRHSDEVRDAACVRLHEIACNTDKELLKLKHLMQADSFGAPAAIREMISCASSNKEVDNRRYLNGLRSIAYTLSADAINRAETLDLIGMKGQNDQKKATVAPVLPKIVVKDLLANPNLEIETLKLVSDTHPDAGIRSFAAGVLKERVKKDTSCLIM